MKFTAMSLLAMATYKAIVFRHQGGVSAFSRALLTRRPHVATTTSFRLFSSSTQEQETTVSQYNGTSATPWNDPRVEARIKTRRRNNNNRFRQHVNPLARQYQQPTELSDQWPVDVFDVVQERPLHIDVGCGKGGFLLAYAASEFAAREEYNYLGLEIRPMVAQFAKERVAIHKLQGKLDFLGCNANVDLDRLLTRYHDAAAAPHLLTRVSIQYPDPHFKKQHAKRRVVTPALVDIIAKYMPPSDGVVFLQSDVKNVLDDMRDRVAEASQYFVLDAALHKDHEYLPDNPLGVPTERELSVLEKDLPVYRVLFQRTATPYSPPSSLSADGNDQGNENI